MKLLLVDGMALLYRAFYALIRRPLRNSRGENTSAIFGFANVMLTLRNQEAPTHWAVVFDTQAPTFRHLQFEQYKAQRPPMPEELVPQIEEVKRLLRAMRVPVLERDGFEADDLMAALARRAGTSGAQVRLYSSDKDLLQVVDERVQALVPRGGGEEAVRMGPDEVRESWGVGPGHIVDVLALMGDSVDNVPGVKGIGEKTAVKLMHQFGSLEALYEQLEEVTPAGVREKLRVGRESAFQSRQLITLDLGCADDIALEGLAVLEPDGTQAADLCREFEFRRLEAKFRGIAGPGPGAPAESGSTAMEAAVETYESDPSLEPDPFVESDPLPRATAESVLTLDVPEPDCYGVEWVRDAARARQVLESLARRDRLVLALPGSDLSARGRAPEWLLFADGAGAWAIPWRDLGADAQVRSAAQECLEHGPEFVTANARAAVHSLLRAGLPLPRFVRDLSIAAYLLELRREEQSQVLGGEENAPAPGENFSLALDDDRPAIEAAAMRARRQWGILPRLEAKLEERGLSALFVEVEVPLAPVLARMEEHGVRVDQEVLGELSTRFGDRLRELGVEIQRLAGMEFNILSSKQLAQVLFEKHGMPPGRKTKTGFSTDSDVLEELALTWELPGRVLEYRQLSKLLSTFVDALPTMVNAETGRIHARFHQTVVPTGRLSSSDPNLQNIPIRTPEGREIRRAFVPEPGWQLISADYSQIELRFMAHFSGEPAFREAFERGEDIHARTAAEVFGLPIAEISSELRTRAKAINFGLMYGMGAQSLGRQLRIPMKEAAAFIERYFARLPRVREFRERLLVEGKRDGFVTTLLGRRITLPDLRSGDRRMLAGAERVALNAPLQGSAADLIKRAMLALDSAIESRRIPARILIQVHDELVLEAESSVAEEVAELARACMVGAARLDVPLVASVGRGQNWYEVHG